MGAHHVSSRSEPVKAPRECVGVGPVKYAVSLSHTEQHFAQAGESIARQGLVGLIGDPASIDLTLLKRESASLHWEFMFTCSPTDDMARQGQLLCEIAEMVDQGQLRGTLGEHYGIINAANLKRSHAIPEAGRARGKPVPDGFR